MDGSPYSTTVNDYNVRDQVKSVTTYQGSEGSGSYLQTSMEYDGYGRLKTRHVPGQNDNTQTVYEYVDDGTVKKHNRRARGKDDIQLQRSPPGN